MTILLYLVLGFIFTVVCWRLGIVMSDTDYIVLAILVAAECIGSDIRTRR